MNAETLKALYSTAKQGDDALRDGDIEPAVSALESIHSVLEGEMLRQGIPFPEDEEAS